MSFLRRKPSPPDDGPALVQWMADEFAAGRYDRVWRHRFELGLGYAQEGRPDQEWFWLNAYPALSALRIESDPGLRHPLVSTCAGWADQVHRSLGEAEREANAEIACRFFGTTA